MLNSSSDAFALKTLNISSRKSTRQERILAVRLKTTAAQRRTLYINGRTEEDVRAFRLGFDCDGFADAREELDVP